MTRSQAIRRAKREIVAESVRGEGNLRHIEIVAAGRRTAGRDFCRYDHPKEAYRIARRAVVILRRARVAELLSRTPEAPRG